MEYVLNIKLFYPMLFFTIIVIAITIGIVIKANNSDFTFRDIFFKHDDNSKDIFNRHSDEHENTTDKMAKMNDNVIHLPYTNKQEKEFHSLETGLKELQEKVADLNDKVDILVKKVLILETKN